MHYWERQKTEALLQQRLKVADGMGTAVAAAELVLGKGGGCECLLGLPHAVVQGAVLREGVFELMRYAVL
jgi:hypothetical protein